MRRFVPAAQFTRRLTCEAGVFYRAPRLAAFWSDLLGTTVAETSDEGRFVFLEAANGHILSFQRVPEPKSVKNRVHLDIRVEDLDDAATAIDLGGTWDGNELTLNDARWRTLRDPEGNEFDIFVTSR